MELVVFAGVSNSGKTELMLNSAKLLVALEKDVLVIDCTSSQGCSSFFILDDKEQNSLSRCQCYYRQGLDIMSDNPYLKSRKLNIGKALSSVDLESYDYIFLECDYTSVESLVKFSDKVVITYNQSKDSLVWFPKTYEICREYDKEILHVGMNIVEGNYDTNFFRTEFSSLLGQDIGEGLVFKHDEEDIKQSIENNVLGAISLYGFSESYKETFYKFINWFEKVPVKVFNKGIKRGVKR